MLLCMTTTVWVGRIGVLAATLGAGAVIGFGTCAEASAAPADSPKTVTRPGSPPKDEMFSRTQRSARTWSSVP